MVRRTRKLTSMVWRNAGEAILLCLILIGAFLYFLHYYGYLLIIDFWPWGLLHSLTALLFTILIASIFAFWQFSRMKKRLELLEDSMLHLEKGNLSHEMPQLGDDEIGRLSDLLSTISRRWEEQVNTLQRMSSNNASLAEKAKFSAVTEERQRLARELHDAVSQQLFAISMTATALGRTIDKNMEQSKRQIFMIEEMSSIAQSEMRALLLHLRPVHLEGKQLVQGLHELLQELKAKVPLKIEFEMDEQIRLPRGVEDHLFRIVQEALSNILRHSKATVAEVKLQKRQDVIRLMVRDNGIGFELQHKKKVSYGLVSMEERVTEVGGTMQIITAPSRGTRIDIRIPIINEAGKPDELKLNHAARTEMKTEEVNEEDEHEDEGTAGG